jgi:hypothetical protein
MLGSLATVVGFLPERIDLTHVLAAYGTGSILGEIVATRFNFEHSATLRPRYGIFLMAVALGSWLILWTLRLL